MTNTDPTVSTSDLLAAFRTADASSLDAARDAKLHVDGVDEADPPQFVGSVSAWRGDLVLALTSAPELGLTHAEFITQVAVVALTPDFRKSRPATIAHRDANLDHPLRWVEMTPSGMRLHVDPKPVGDDQAPDAEGSATEPDGA